MVVMIRIGAELEEGGPIYTRLASLELEVAVWPYSQYRRPWCSLTSAKIEPSSELDPIRYRKLFPRRETTTLIFPLMLS